MLKSRFLKQMNLIETIFKFKFKIEFIIKLIIIYKKNFADKKCKFINHKKNI